MRSWDDPEERVLCFLPFILFATIATLCFCVAIFVVFLTAGRKVPCEEYSNALMRDVPVRCISYFTEGNHG